MKRAIIGLLGGLTLATLAGPANAQPVTYQVDLFYDKIVDGPRPTEMARITMRAVSAEAAEAVCGSPVGLLRLSRNVKSRNPHAFTLPAGNWMGMGGRCVTDADGNVVMTVEASGEGN